MKNGVIMARPTKLTPEIQKKIGDGVSLGLTYALAASAAGITYQSLNQWMQRGKNSTSGKYFEFTQHIQKCNVDAAKNCLERLNAAAKAGDTRICMFILERRFPEEFGRRVYKKTNAISENKNVNAGIIVNNADEIRDKIIEKITMVREIQGS